LTDEELMQAYAAGDMEAFEVLYRGHKNRILGFLAGKLKSRDEAEEVFQTVFTKLHLARTRYRPEIPFLPWVFTIARNALIDQVRKDQTRRQHVTLSEEAVALYPAPSADDTSIGAGVAELASLNETQRHALELRFNQGLTFREIAEQLQLSPDNSRQIVGRAIGKLRRLLGRKERNHDQG
jgi:RNA polymerase sigma-70 factor (ECF subfamily)